MCGIAGILVLRETDASHLHENLDRMAAVLTHRGPDGTGKTVCGNIGLAHTRLSIIDLASGAQPMSDAAGEVQLVFNGEIFNYIELREELQAAGRKFQTASDTETIIHAYLEYGDEFLQHLNGQFAIGLWDRRRKRLVLARDRAGIRPLFIRRTESRIIFASEVKAIAAVGGETLHVSPHALGQIFTFWGTIGGLSVFKDVETLPAGHMMTVEGGRVAITRYWDWEFPRSPVVGAGSYEESAEELRALLVDAVQLQLRADVPVGAYLSGGLDSSGIVSLIRHYTNVRLRTFSVTFEDAEFDESSHQAELVKYLQTDHTSVRCTRKDIGEAFPRLIWHAETPLVRTASVPLMLLSGLVRESRFKVVLTGEGADEVFGGYDLFKEGLIRRFWARHPASRWRPLLLGRLYSYLQHSPVGSLAYARETFGRDLTDIRDPGYAHRVRWETTARIWNFFSADVRAELAGYNVRQDLVESLPVDFNDWEGLSRDQYVEAKTLLEGYLLSSQGDRVAMANSVEGRFPYLDHRIIEFANRLPARYKIRGLKEKAVLRAALRDILPPGVAGRTKQPYRAPDASSFFSDGIPLPYVAECFEAKQIREAGYFDPGPVTRLFEKCRAGLAIGFADNMAFVGILSTMLLHEMFVQRRFRAS